MKRLPPADLTAFLRLADGALRSKGSVVIVGGAAIALAYRGSRYVTFDIDVIRVEGDDVQRAFDAAAGQATVPVPVSYVGAIAVAPVHYEDRLLRILPDLRKLTVYVPERHDLAIMKIARGTEHDLAGLEEVHSTSPLTLDLLLSRFEEVLPVVTGPLAEFQWAFLACVSRLFADEETERAKKEVERLTKELERRGSRS